MRVRVPLTVWLKVVEAPKVTVPVKTRVQLPPLLVKVPPAFALESNAEPTVRLIPARLTWAPEFKVMEARVRLAVSKVMTSLEATITVSPETGGIPPTQVVVLLQGPPPVPFEVIVAAHDPTARANNPTRKPILFAAGLFTNSSRLFSRAAGFVRLIDINVRTRVFMPKAERPRDSGRQKDGDKGRRLTLSTNYSSPWNGHQCDRHANLSSFGNFGFLAKL